jgi:hypothetical protein
MQKHTNQSTNTNSKYVPPSKKHVSHTNTSLQTNTSLNLTKKREPKKEFLLNPDDNSAFPTLNPLTASTNLKPALSFANATKKELDKERVDIVSDVKPGWVHIRKHKGKIEYKYGKATEIFPYYNDNNNSIFNNRLAIEQYERDSDIIRLGDLSEYYGEKTIYEMFEEEERLMNNTNDSDNSSSSETEYESYFDTYDNNKFDFNAQ